MSAVRTSNLSIVVLAYTSMTVLVGCTVVDADRREASMTVAQWLLDIPAVPSTSHRDRTRECRLVRALALRCATII